MVALAARFAEHVRPLFTAFWPAAPQQHASAVEFAVRLATTGASVGATCVNDAGEAGKAAEVAAEAAADADTGVGVPNGPAYSAHVARAAAYAAYAADAASDGNFDATAVRVSDCLRAAANAAGAVTKQAGVERIIDRFLTKAHRELARLKSQSPANATNARADRSGPPTADDLGKLPPRAVVAYAAGRARSAAEHVDIAEEDPEAAVRASDLGWVLSLLDRYSSGSPVSEEQLDRALAVANALPTSVWGEDGVEAADVIWHAVECMAAVARSPGDRRTFLKWAANSALVSDDHLDSSAMTIEAWEDYDRLLSQERL